MKEKILYAIWASLYILCVGLGTVENAAGLGKALLIASAVIFFLPGGALLYHGLQTGNNKVLQRLRLVCLTSLVLTLILIVANLMSVSASAKTGKVLYDLLQLFSAPMLCGQYWALSLFLWACLLMASFTKIRKK